MTNTACSVIVVCTAPIVQSLPLFVVESIALNCCPGLKATLPLRVTGAFLRENAKCWRKKNSRRFFFSNRSRTLIEAESTQNQEKKPIEAAACTRQNTVYKIPEVFSFVASKRPNRWMYIDI